jgi:hypothetical protein
MTDFYDVEELLTSLGIGEAAVTVLSPRGVPTPLAATRLIAPDSSMNPMPDTDFAARIAASPLQAKYGTVVDRDSAYERITTRLANARAAAAQAAAAQQMPPTSAGGLNSPGMTPAQQRREIQRQVREAKAAQRAAERERKRLEAEAKRDARARQRSIDNAIRTSGRVVTSRAGQSILRGVFDTIFGGGRR